ncbi:MAG: ATP-binding cassette domain-containing protein [Candidatus Cloacimonetes bacterium]|nr:ATP-binding cassette domain-containing protein [Candidatus Cloacimonadota bacterium]MCF8306304.1 ATP-binding cassette domain-containing protein [Ignavibacteriales bacterium]MCF8316025.1 ATP-binding cassette domain-containing protein [Ignavibacteriales bacterium]MCF8437619.1 ATP-binding cassette domain-containing protein [Ignavibacteriales bacterium]
MVENFSLQVEKGDCIAITGPNGSGKSTLLKAIYQLCVINSGKIIYKGQSLNGRTAEQVKKMGISYFMQKNAIFNKLSVKENLEIAYPENILDNLFKEESTFTNSAVSKFKLFFFRFYSKILFFNLRVDLSRRVKKYVEILWTFSDFYKWTDTKKAGLLSVGQRQQLALAMLYAQEADLWLLDEPTAGLDADKSEIFVQMLLKHSWKTSDNPKTIIFVEHKNEIINKLANKIINFKGE